MLLANVLQPLISVEEWTLEALHSIGLGWGLAIVGLTLLVRACTVPLVVRQFRAQRELRDHMPRVKELRKRHRSDKERMQRELREYYREHEISPLSAFLPLLVQIPVFISLYYLMRTDAKSGLFGDAGLLFIPDLTDKPHGAGAVRAHHDLPHLPDHQQPDRHPHDARGPARPDARPTAALRGAGRPLPAGLAVYWITTSLWTLGQQTCLWRLAPAAAPIGASLPPERPEPPPPAAPRRRTRKRKHGRPR